MWMRFVALVSLLLCAAEGKRANAEDHICSTFCPKTRAGEGKQGFLPGHTYTYHYETQTEMSLGPSGDKSRVSISGLAKIDAIDHCNMRLRLSGVRLSDSSASEALDGWAEELESTPLDFALDGRGGVAKICPEASASGWVVNVGAGVVSLLGTTTHAFTTAAVQRHHHYEVP